MGLLEDMLKALDRVEIWKELQAAPHRISELEKRGTSSLLKNSGFG